MRLNALDGWRGIACLMVAAFHFSAAHSLYFQPWLRNCAPLLEFFFIVSGFVMALAFADAVKDGRGLVAYLIRRLGRIWPLHLITLAALIALAGMKALAGAENGGFFGRFDVHAIVPQIFMTHTWVGMGLTWNFPAWTLSAEFAAYLVFGLLVLLVQDRMLRILGAAALVVIGASAFYTELLMPREEYSVSSVARCFTGFFLGFMLRDLWAWRPIKSEKLATALELALVAAFVVALQARFEGGAYFINYLVFGALVYVFANDRGWVSRVLSAPPLLWLGKVSFSLYMVHAVIKIFVENGFYVLEKVTNRAFFAEYANPFSTTGAPVELMTLGATWQNDLLLTAYLCAAVLAAWLAYTIVEDPTRSYSAALAKRYQRGEFAFGAFASRLVRRRRPVAE